ncbi:MAG: Lrp/AsnC family transcriptional regulator [Candidatus Woesearchaeota archaeon]
MLSEKKEGIQMKKEDLFIISNLRRDARQPLTAISKQLRIPVSTLYEKIRELEGSVIKKYTAIPNYEKLGFNLRIIYFLSFKEKHEENEKLRVFLINHHNVNSVFRISGDYNFVVDCIFRSVQEMHDFAMEIERFEIEKKKICYVMNELKVENFLIEQNYVEKILQK